MIHTLIGNIRTTLGQLVGSGKPLQVVYDYPEPNLSGYPAAVFFLTDYMNEFNSTTENSKEYRFSIFLLLETKLSGLQNAYNDIMPKLVDQVIEKFDNTWNQGETLNENRVYWNLNAGNWLRVEDQKETFLQAELILTVRLNNSI